MREPRGLNCPLYDLSKSHILYIYIYLLKSRIIYLVCKIVVYCWPKKKKIPLFCFCFPVVPQDWIFFHPNPFKPWISTHFLPQKYSISLCWHSQELERWQKAARWHLKGKRTKKKEIMNQSNGKKCHQKKRSKTKWKAEELTWLKSQRGQSGRAADVELWKVRRPFSDAEEVFGFYWFHMTRQNLFKTV